MGLILAVILGVSASAFDASQYLGAKAAAAEAQVADPALKSMSIFRIDGRRFLKLESGEGAVWLPAPGDKPMAQTAFALCQQHLKLLDVEVFQVREGLEVDAGARSVEPAVRELIRACRDGKIRGPKLVRVTRDGAVVEIETKK